ncbi:hypothetical protein [Eudoraea adriatica]|nr:hypothetical protein [Eudoraea adriatica]
MEKIYSEERNACKLAKTSPETIRFLLDYSRSFRITKYKKFKFETTLN